MTSLLQQLSEERTMLRMLTSPYGLDWLRQFGAYTITDVQHNADLCCQRIRTIEARLNEVAA